MLTIQPKVFLIAHTTTTPEYAAALKELGGEPEEIPTDTAPSAGKESELLIGLAGRTCYKSFKAGLNPNVTKVRSDDFEYIGNVLKQKHGSIFEHASVSFLLTDVSRVVTHELVRHRAGTAFSQESMRYVRIEEFRMHIPECIRELGPEAVQLFRDAVDQSEAYTKKISALIDWDNITFHKKKELTSALRRIAPAGAATNIVVTANHRAWRHMIEMRTSYGAEEEIRIVFALIAEELKRAFPAIYQDMFANTDEPAAYEFENSKV